MDTLGKVLAQIASQLGVTAAHLWPQLVAVTFYQSLAWLILDPIILIVSSIVTWKVGTWAVAELRTPHDSYHDDTGAELVLFLTAVIYIIVAGLVVITLPGVLAGVLAPEGMTALRLLGEITGK